MKHYLLPLIAAGLFAQLILSSCNCAKESSDSRYNPAIENIFARKSVRNYDTSKRISADTLELLVKAAMAAPSAMNRQPWQFLVFSAREQMDTLAQKLPYAKMLKKAAAAIVILGNPKISGSWHIDCAAATQNLLLAAESLGLGAVWTAGYPYEERMSAINSVLQIPSPWLPLALVPVGYPAGETLPKDKWDPSKVHYDKW